MQTNICNCNLAECNTCSTAKIQPQPYPLQGQSLATGWGQYPQGAYYPPPVQKPQEIREEVTYIQQQQPITEVVEIREVREVPVIQTEVIREVKEIPVVKTTEIITENVTGYGYGRQLLGPNTYGIPENFPWLPADASCHKCHGTGYKKSLLTRHWKPCKKCAHKYGTDIKSINLRDLPAYSGMSNVGYMGNEMVGTTITGNVPYYGGAATTTTYTSGNIVGGTTRVLPSGFQTLPANPHCIKCEGLGYELNPKSNLWSGCATCAQQYGTNLANVIIPSNVTSSVPLTSTSGTYTTSNIIY